jgi:heterodisulfide reductase subunit C
MEKMQGFLKFRPEAELDLGFIDEVAKMPDGKALYNCIQCGTCSGTCPLAIYMDYSPRRIIAMTRAGFKNEVLSSFTIWLCASCYECSVECPRQIKIADFMAELKQISLREGFYSSQFKSPVLAREFFKLVQKRGRSSEFWVAFLMYLKTNPIQILRLIPFGIKLLLKGRVNLKLERVKKPSQIKILLEAISSNQNKVGVNLT